MALRVYTPIGRLIACRACELGLSKNDLVHLMSYANLDKGRRRLERFLAGEPLPDVQAQALRESLGVGVEKWEAATSETRREKAEEAERRARERFRPHLFAETRGPETGPIFVRALAFGDKVIPVTEGIADWPWREQQDHVSRVIRAHCAQHGGTIPHFGEITGYRYHATYDHAVAFSTDGKITKAFDDPGKEAGPVITVKGRPIPPGLFRR